MAANKATQAPRTAYIQQGRSFMGIGRGFRRKVSGPAGRNGVKAGWRGQSNRAIVSQGSSQLTRDLCGGNATVSASAPRARGPESFI